MKIIINIKIFIMEAIIARKSVHKILINILHPKIFFHAHHYVQTINIRMKKMLNVFK